MFGGLFGKKKKLENDRFKFIFFKLNIAGCLSIALKTKKITVAQTQFLLNVMREQGATIHLQDITYGLTEELATFDNFQHWSEFVHIMASGQPLPENVKTQLIKNWLTFSLIANSADDESLMNLIKEYTVTIDYQAGLFFNILRDVMDDVSIKKPWIPESGDFDEYQRILQDTLSRCILSFD